MYHNLSLIITVWTILNGKSIERRYTDVVLILPGGNASTSFEWDTARRSCHSLLEWERFACYIVSTAVDIQCHMLNISTRSQTTTTRSFEGNCATAPAQAPLAQATIAKLRGIYTIPSIHIIIITQRLIMEWDELAANVLTPYLRAETKDTRLPYAQSWFSNPYHVPSSWPWSQFAALYRRSN